MKTIIIGQVFIQTKFCVWGGEGTKLCFEKQTFYVKIAISIVYYKSLSYSNWLENDYNWACFYSN